MIQLAQATPYSIESVGTALTGCSGPFDRAIGFFPIAVVALGWAIWCSWVIKRVPINRQIRWITIFAWVNFIISMGTLIPYSDPCGGSYAHWWSRTAALGISWWAVIAVVYLLLFGVMWSWNTKKIVRRGYIVITLEVLVVLLSLLLSSQAIRQLL